MFHDNDNRRFVVLDREDLDTICDALSALAFALTQDVPSERLRSAARVDGIVQEISAKYDLPGEPTR
jgi:hypothetical protein